MIVAIDGVSGAGKGTLSELLSSKYDMKLLDTGLLFRVVAYRANVDNVNYSNVDALVSLATNLQDNDLNNKALRCDNLGITASKIAVYPELRAALIQYMRNFANKYKNTAGGVILDGRDIGSIVCPDADIKFFVTARVEIRAQRRLKQLQNYGITCIYEDVLRDMKERDKRDTERKSSPLVIAHGAVVIDTSDLSLKEMVLEASKHIDAVVR